MELKLLRDCLLRGEFGVFLWTLELICVPQSGLLVSQASVPPVREEAIDPGPARWGVE